MATRQASSLSACVLPETGFNSEVLEPQTFSRAGALFSGGWATRTVESSVHGESRLEKEEARTTPGSSVVHLLDTAATRELLLIAGDFDFDADAAKEDEVEKKVESSSSSSILVSRTE
mmetsp:Transcript_29803/g.50242  ORF Transcript_29803/g.50242 Transcript_29803/m.50242 type:complete len:118 (+) Transcript_29803:313-666(+)